MQKKLKNRIPWSSPEAWLQCIESIRTRLSAMGSQVAGIKELSQEIAKEYAAIEASLDQLCSICCPHCDDVCCLRATVWYDLKDLLVIYGIFSRFPDGYIYREYKGGCCNLTISGCRLARAERPFICTWYICPSQKKVLEKGVLGSKGLALLQSIDRLKAARKMIEQIYLAVD